MRPLRFISIIFFITVISITYVWQQVKIFEAAYVQERTLKKYYDILDENKNLRYNQARIESLTLIGDKIAKDNFEIPSDVRIVAVNLKPHQ
ncbi:MAG: hypothetical protein AB1755_01930 [Candidatus Omnitrophota bacterium]